MAHWMAGCTGVWLPYREEKPLSSTGLEQLLPLFLVAHGEGDWVDLVLELGCDGPRPLAQLKNRSICQIVKACRPVFWNHMFNGSIYGPAVS